MTSDLLSLLGIEGIAIFSLIVLVSIGLSGFRFSAAGMNGEVAGDVPADGRLRIRQRLAKRLARPAENSKKRSQSRDAVKIAGWFFAATRGDAAKKSANQSGFDGYRAGFTRVKIVSAATPVQRAVDQAASDDHRACVSSSEPKRVDSETQWQRVNAIVNEGLAQAKEIEELHAAAARQLDAVDYAYERMLLELRDVLPGVVESRSVCRTHRDEAYAAVNSAPSASAGPEGVVEKADAQRTISSVDAPSPAVADRSKDRKPKTAESVAA